MRIYGYDESFPNSTEFGELTAVFNLPLVGSDNIMPRFFTHWMNFIHNMKDGPSSGLNMRFPQDYYGTLYVTTMDDEDHPTITYKIVNAYPKMIQDVELQWEAQHSFATFGVSFNYSYWQHLPYQPPPDAEIHVNL